MNALLHICCAPCAIYPVEEMKKTGAKIAGLFYNPNIHPYSEYLKRRTEAEKLSKAWAINVIYNEYDPEKYFQLIVYNESTANRCPICWWLRLEEAARFAKENGFDAFTTTLLGSPYQDHDAIRKIGEDVGRRAGLDFHYADFRKGFRDAHKRAREEGIYCQKYCGCIFSEKEMIEAKNPKRHA